MKNTLIIIYVLFLSVACTNSDKGINGDMEASFEELLDIPVTMQPPPQEEVADAEQITKKVVKTGGIDFQSENIAKDYKKIREILPKFKAYIENENQSKTSQRISYDLTVRVPSDSYDSLYCSLSNLAYRLDNRYSSVEDVTARYYDLDTRIKNKIALEQRYVELLLKASVIKDILEIENKLNELRTEIESIQGQFNYLSKQVTHSTISLSFYEVLPYVYDSSPRKGFGQRILSALNSGWQGFLSFLVALTTLWPFVVSLVAGLFLFRNVRKKWKRKSA